LIGGADNAENENKKIGSEAIQSHSNRETEEE
jgi:hypothetical protein